MHRSCIFLALFGSACLCIGCAGPTAKLTYRIGGIDLAGYKFVVPRTAVNVAVASAPKEDKKPAEANGAAPAATAGAKGVPDGSARLTLTPVPRAYDKDNRLLTVFTVIDDSGGGLGDGGSSTFGSLPKTITPARSSGRF